MYGPPIPSSLQDAFRIGLAASVRPVSTWEGEGIDMIVREFFGPLDEFDEDGGLRAFVSSQTFLPPNELARLAGNRIAQGLALGTVAEIGSTVPRRWRLVDREPQFRRINRVPVRIRGLPQEEQAAVNRRLARIARHEIARAARHANDVAPYLERLLAYLAATGIVIPVTWHEFVPADIVERWPSVTEASGLLVGLHRDWPIPRQVEWMRKIEAEVDGVALERLRAGLTAFLPSSLGDFDAEDLDAFARIGEERRASDE